MIPEIVNRLPEPYRTQILPYLKNIDYPSDLHDIVASFNWSRTTEGEDYWCHFYNSLILTEYDDYSDDYYDDDYINFEESELDDESGDLIFGDN